MNSEERQLISDLFNRMQGHGPVEKDPEAAAFISERVRSMPDAAYMLVQSVIVQDMTLQQADERIRALEARVNELERAPRAAASSGGGSFLGGMFGGSRPAAPAGTHGSVPATGGGLGRSGAQPSSPWGSARGMQPAPGGMMAQQPSQGGGFLRTAMATAAGVAGGMLLADGIRNMMSGSDATTTTAASETAADTTPVDSTEYQDAAENDPGVQDASYDDGGDFGGDFDV